MKKKKRIFEEVLKQKSQHTAVRSITILETPEVSFEVSILRTQGVIVVSINSKTKSPMSPGLHDLGLVSGDLHDHGTQRP